MMLNWLKHLIARDELAELERYRVGVANARRWLGEFPDAKAALAHVRHVADGTESYAAVEHLSEAMRKRRNKDLEQGFADGFKGACNAIQEEPSLVRDILTPRTMTPADLDALAAHIHLGGAPGETRGPGGQTLMRAVPVDPSFPDGPWHGVPATEWDVAEQSTPVRLSAQEYANNAAQSGWLTWEAFYAAFKERFPNRNEVLHLGMSVAEAYGRVSELVYGERRIAVDPYPQRLAILWRDLVAAGCLRYGPAT